MRIAILGTGGVGRTLADGLSRAGHEIRIGTRDAAATMARTEPDGLGNPPFVDWARTHPDVALCAFDEAAAWSELVVNATSGDGSMDALAAAGADNVSGKVLVDVSNPLDFSGGFPPRLSVVNDDSLAERIQRAYPEARVVKTLNTVTASVMIAPGSLAAGEHHVFLSGNDSEAKATAKRLLADLGWKHILDLGDITTARGTEMYLALWVRLYGALGTGDFNVRLVQS